MPRDGGRPLNAFEIINAALDISALFERRSDVVKRHTRFTSRESPERIAEEMEAAHTQLGGTSERNSFKCAGCTVPRAIRGCTWSMCSLCSLFLQLGRRQREAQSVKLHLPIRSQSGP